MKIDKFYDKKNNIELKIYIGENASDNWKIIDNSNHFDIWFHLLGSPSSHVILHLPDKHFKCDSKALLYCANLVKHKSKLKMEKKVPVIYTFISNIKKGKEIGSVTTIKTNKLLI
jgi:predicted ribosome quality control (RQC) complex YloA/Tae2 family protein